MRRSGTCSVFFAVGAATVSGCLVQVVDLRSELPGDPQAGCLADERLDPATGECAACLVMRPVPGECLCAWEYRAAPFPYCDRAGSYYECLPCHGGILACNAFTPTTIAFQLGVTRDCAAIAACCEELTDHFEPCCYCGATMRCEPDPNDSEQTLFKVFCDPEPACHGKPCPYGLGDCEAWQTDCVAGECTPACNPVTETCSLDAGCVCEAVPN